MKKIIVGCLFTILILCVSVYFIINKNDNRMIYENNNDESHIVNTNALTMMYETEAGSGEYQVSSNTTWPQDGYVFNETLSKCENGGVLSWDDENKKVMMQASASDRCYVYFDVYLKATINDVTYESTSDSVTITTSVIVGDAEIVTYHYSINNGEYITSGSNTYTFSNLTSGMTYNISVYVTDKNNRKSNAYSTSVTTKNNIEIVSYDLSLSHGFSNYLLNVVINPSVEVQKYVLELSNGVTLETESLGYGVWASCSADGFTNFRPKTVYSYNLYLITVDNEVSKPVSGQLTTDAEATACSI